MVIIFGGFDFIKKEAFSLLLLLNFVIFLNQYAIAMSQQDGQILMSPKITSSIVALEELHRREELESLRQFLISEQVVFCLLSFF